MNFEAFLGFTGSTATLHLAGSLDDASLPVLRSLVDQAVQQPLRQLVLRIDELESMTPGGVRCLAFAQQHVAPDVEIIVDGANEQVREAMRLGGFDQAVTFVAERAVLAG
ncbi:STAS domain-containing protein [Salinactinospora qingdaonensis]|uniref:STAS domain-containing protein n=1 Tax=Salinactinospora qingdaonensis TaxID=702744 RepID=A0ABP7G2M5_9ACTN